MTTRRPRWHPPPPPSPKIIHLPRRLRRAKPPKTASKNGGVAQRQGKLWSLFDQERAFARGGVPVVVLSSSSDVSGVLGAGGEGRGTRTSGAGATGSTEEEWRFQAEFLRAECHFLRMEREVALKKRERNRVQTEKAMKSAVQALTLRQSMISEGENAGLILEEEIQELEEKLEGLHRSPRGGGEARKCCNFDKKASALRRRMEKLGPTEEEHAEEKRCIREIRELAEASLGGRHGTSEKVVSGRKSRLADVETIRRKMEGLSKGMLERMEEYGGLLGGTATTTSVASSAAALVKTEFPETEVRPRPQEKRCGEDRGVCSGRCKSIVKKIVDQVRAETEQWTQLQAMLGQVREEMIELQASKDKWQRRVIESHSRLQTTKSDMQEWKQRAKRAETKAMELEKQVSELQTEMMTLRKCRSNADKPVIDIENAWGLAKLDGSQKTLEHSHKEKEKRVLVCRLKENLPVHGGKRNKEEASEQPSRIPEGPGTPSRRPLGELGNNSQSPSIRNGRAAHPLLF